jgi:hypothetical protein
MTIKLPVEVEQFAKEYFAAQERASDYFNGRKVFRTIDQKELARKCKALFESGAVESMYQLTKDLAAYKPGYTSTAHTLRLGNFAKRTGITYPKPAAPVAAPAAAPVAAPVKTEFNLKSVLNTHFHQALRSGISITVLQEQVAEVVGEHTKRVHTETRIQDLVRKTGLNRQQLSEIATVMQGLAA